VAGFQHNWGIMFCKMTKNKKTHFPWFVKQVKRIPDGMGFFLVGNHPLHVFIFFQFHPLLCFFTWRSITIHQFCFEFKILAVGFRKTKYLYSNLLGIKL
jgi:hypothetical protein